MDRPTEDQHPTDEPVVNGNTLPLSEMDAWQTAAMATLIQQRHELFVEILKLSLQQEAAIKEGLVEKLVTCLNHKQQRIDQLKALQQELAPYAQCPVENRQWADEAARQQCRDWIAESARLQAATLEIDARCELTMSQRRDEIFQQLTTTNGAMQAANAYDQAASGSSAGSRGRGGSLDFTSQ